MPWLILILQPTSTPGDCMLTGLCGVFPPRSPVASGVMFVAVGLVAFGFWQLRKARRARRLEGSGGTARPGEAPRRD